MEPHNKLKGIVTGIIIMMVGGFWLLDETGILPHWIWSEFIISWQMLLIAIGIISMTNTDNKTPGFVLVIIGIIFLIIEYVRVDSEILFALGLMLIGAFILFRNFTGKKFERSFQADKGDPGYFEITSIFSGGDHKITSKELKGGKITSIFGGSDVNLYNADMLIEPMQLEIFTLFGGVSLSVPPDWEVKVDVQPVFGGFSDKRRYQEPAPGVEPKRLIIRGTLIFGGGEIKS
jgi:predicted membrane protein